ncbi:hypothetical protein O3P69_000435 [Scylla paramamosain]|uniref:Uncharacterized protein n=1 Tax=Scylla paramamosain TaxID=85552 RepID=A0AAW0UTF3_SCYPA
MALTGYSSQQCMRALTGGATWFDTHLFTPIPRRGGVRRRNVNSGTTGAAREGGAEHTSCRYCGCRTRDIAWEIVAPYQVLPKYARKATGVCHRSPCQEAPGKVVRAVPATSGKPVVVVVVVVGLRSAGSVVVVSASLESEPTRFLGRKPLINQSTGDPACIMLSFLSRRLLPGGGGRCFASSQAIDLYYKFYSTGLGSSGRVSQLVVLAAPRCWRLLVLIQPLGDARVNAGAPPLTTTTTTTTTTTAACRDRHTLLLLTPTNSPPASSSRPDINRPPFPSFPPPSLHSSVPHRHHRREMKEEEEEEGILQQGRKFHISAAAEWVCQLVVKFVLRQLLQRVNERCL